MLTSPDFKELLSVFKSNEVRFLVVGGYAVMRYTEPRYTKDLDIWIAADKVNANRVFKALKEFGARETPRLVGCREAGKILRRIMWVLHVSLGAFEIGQLTDSL